MDIILLLKILDGLVFIGIVILIGVVIKEARAYNKKYLLKNEIWIAKKSIIQEEIAIEAAWVVLNNIQDESEKMKKEVEANLEEIKAEKDKTPMNMERIKELLARNVALGKTDRRAKNGDIIWDGEILQKDIIAERHNGEITQLVGKREYLKIKLRTLLEMKKKGYLKDFDKFQNEQLIKHNN